MNQKERNELSRSRILKYASIEFAEQGYYRSSVNRICSNGKISKGLLYHYFKDKDDLYLACIKRCFDEIVAGFLKELDKESVTVDEYFDCRILFFEKNPVCFSLFLEAMTNRWPYLQEQIAVCRSEFDSLNVNIFTTILERENPSGLADREFALTLLTIVQSGFNVYLGSMGMETVDPKAHSKLCKKIINTVIRRFPLA